MTPRRPVVPSSTSAFDAQGDLCLGFFQQVYDDAKPVLPHGARVLELGCAEANWLASMRKARPDLHLTGLDYRQVERRDADELIRADLLTHDFPEALFDAIVAVSVVEWCGIGNYKDPVDPDGDRKMMQRCRRWIKPGGWMYVDTPVALDQVSGDGFVRRQRLRAYTDAGLMDRLWQGLWTERRRWHFSPDHPDGPYVAVLLDPV